MPYSNNHDLPPSVRSHLPDHAQDIYREAFNDAYRASAGDGDRDRRAQMVAWSAVKQSYVQDDDTWVMRPTSAF